MKNSNILFALIICSTLLFACNKKTAPSKTNTTAVAAGATKIAADYEKEGYVKAIVIDMSEIASCGYILQIEGTDTKLEPTPPLAEKFQKVDLKVWVKYAEKKNAVSSCMVGKKVDITSIEIRNE